MEPNGEAPGRVYELASDYVDRLEDGQAPRLDDYLERLPARAHAEFREVVETTEWLRQQMPADVAAPQRTFLDRYRLLRELGAGGFGKVWAAEDLELGGRRVAVKLMSPLTSSTIETSLVHDAEREALARIRHPGTVTIFEAGRTEDLFYTVMELVEGRPLDDVLARMRASFGDGVRRPTGADLLAAVGVPAAPGEPSLVDGEGGGNWDHTVVRIVIELLRVFEAVHAEGVVHRDVKPSNIMIGGSGRPVVLDFGLASQRELQRGQVTERIVGTLQYMAPEQLENRRIGSDPRTDLYQIGLVLQELLTLRPTFGPDDDDLFNAVRTGCFRRPRQVRASLPRALEDICLRAVELDPQRRYQTAIAFREDLEAWLGGDRAPRASRGGAFATTLRNARYFARRRRVGLGLATAAIVGVVATLTFTIGGGEARIEFLDDPEITSTSARTRLRSTSAATVFALLHARTPERLDYYLPLRTGGGRAGAAAGWGRVLAERGEHVVDWLPPAGAELPTADGLETSVLLYRVSDDATCAEFDAGWDELAGLERAERGLGPGIDAARVAQLLLRLCSTGRGDGSPLTRLPPPELLLAPDTWSVADVVGVQRRARSERRR